ncbi:ParB/RepB/Spo0J family partition protein (plasmid) [Polaromonas sp. P1-6]|nr:ParB/RepB/Spo0J family partition protein [Polaromonas sp. P1-6]
MNNKSTQAEFVLDLVPGAVKEAMQGTTSSDLWKCNIDDIVVIDEFNVRDKDADYDAKVREYADSMKAIGFLPSKPLALFVARIDGKSVNVLYDGHRRLAAAKLARSEGTEITTVPAVTAPKGTSMEDLTIALVTTNNGEPLKPHQIAIVCKRLVAYGMETGEIAKKLSFTKTYVESLLQLMSAPRVIRDMVTTGKVSATLAIDTIKKHGSEAAKVLNDASEIAQASGKERVTKSSSAPPRSSCPSGICLPRA